MVLEGLKGRFYLFCAFTFAGTSVISAKFVSDKIGTFTITTVSLFFALIVLLPLCYKGMIKTIKLMSSWDFILLCLQALFGIFLFRMFLLKGLLFTSAGEAGIVTGTTPAITATLAHFLLKEPVSKKSMIGILSTVAGIFLIQGLLVSGDLLTIKHLLGNILVICAASSESIFNIICRASVIKNISLEREPMDIITQTTIVSAVALLMCLIPTFFEHPILSLSAIVFKEVLALFWYGVFVTALAFIFWYAGIKRCGGCTAAAFSGMMPFTSLVLSLVILGEHIVWFQWLGGVLVILGMVLIGSNGETGKK